MGDTGGRFAFGKNWESFLSSVDDQRIDQSVKGLVELLRLEVSDACPRPLQGKSFLDIGSGSGLSSLAAWKLGADVVSFDYDSDSVACTRFLHQERGPSDEGDDAPTWTVHQGSVLDTKFMDEMLGLASGPLFDVVYSWGVLHHTGAMEDAIDSASRCVGEDGRFAIAIYNDQGGGSRRWLAIKRGYNALPAWLRPLYVGLVASFYEAKFAVARLARGRNPLPFADWREKKSDRGMSAWHDWVDWIGGLPFEVATPEAIILPLRRQGFVLDNLRTVGSGWGCNEFLFSRKSR